MKGISFFFGFCRDIKNTTGVQFPVPGRDTSTAFVTFKSQKDAKKGITKLNGMKLKGKTLLF